MQALALFEVRETTSFTPASGLLTDPCQPSVIHNVSTNRDDSGPSRSIPVDSGRVANSLADKGLTPEPQCRQSVARSGRIRFDSFPAHHPRCARLAAGTSSASRLRLVASPQGRFLPGSPLQLLPSQSLKRQLSRPERLLRNISTLERRVAGTAAREASFWAHIHTCERS